MIIVEISKIITDISCNLHTYLFQNDIMVNNPGDEGKPIEMQGLQQSVEWEQEPVRWEGCAYDFMSFKEWSSSSPRKQHFHG